ncbi:MAG: hypothetical protein Q8M16_09265 [Pirellulaceae bacterium]|nr:hypothetical protein [Pirellulaceae bacterium]
MIPIFAKIAERLGDGFTRHGQVVSTHGMDFCVFQQAAPSCRAYSVYWVSKSTDVTSASMKAALDRLKSRQALLHSVQPEILATCRVLSGQMIDIDSDEFLFVIKEPHLGATVGNGQCPVGQVFGRAMDLFQSLERLHQLQLPHANLTPDSIFQDSDKRLWLGCSILGPMDSTKDSNLGNLESRYIDSIILSGGSSPDYFRADLYAVAVMLSEWLAGSQEVAKCFRGNEYDTDALARKLKSTRAPRHLIALILDLLKPNPQQRHVKHVGDAIKRLRGSNWLPYTILTGAAVVAMGLALFFWDNTTQLSGKVAELDRRVAKLSQDNERLESEKIIAVEVVKRQEAEIGMLTRELETFRDPSGPDEKWWRAYLAGLNAKPVDEIAKALDELLGTEDGTVPEGCKSWAAQILGAYNPHSNLVSLGDPNIESRFRDWIKQPWDAERQEAFASYTQAYMKALMVWNDWVDLTYPDPNFYELAKKEPTDTHQILKTWIDELVNAKGESYRLRLVKGTATGHQGRGAYRLLCINEQYGEGHYWNADEQTDYLRSTNQSPVFSWQQELPITIDVYGAQSWVYKAGIRFHFGRQQFGGPLAIWQLANASPLAFESRGSLTLEYTVERSSGQKIPGPPFFKSLLPKP